MIAIVNDAGPLSRNLLPSLNKEEFAKFEKGSNLVKNSRSNNARDAAKSKVNIARDDEYN